MEQNGRVFFTAQFLRRVDYCTVSGAENSSDGQHCRLQERAGLVAYRSAVGVDFVSRLLLVLLSESTSPLPRGYHSKAYVVALRVKDNIYWLLAEVRKS